MSSNEKMISILTINQFVDEMEKLYEVEGIGYMKVLEKAKEMKKENEELKNKYLSQDESDEFSGIVYEYMEKVKKENDERRKFLKKASTSMEKMDNIIKGQKKENEKQKKEIEYFKRIVEEEQDSHSKTLNNIEETFNFTEHRKKQAELHAGKFNKPESVEGHYRTLIGDWYMMCIKEDIKKLKKENEDLKEKVEYLSEYQDDHPAMRHKVVLDADYYQTHCSCDYGSLEEMSEKIEELEDQIEQGVYMEQAYYAKFCGNDYEGGIEEMSEKIEELQKELKEKIG